MATLKLNLNKQTDVTASTPGYWRPTQTVHHHLDAQAMRDEIGRLTPSNDRLRELAKKAKPAGI